MTRVVQVATIALLAFGCSGAQTGPVVQPGPFTEEHSRVFENGVDLVRDPDALGGSWLGTWEEDLEKRVGWADAVGLLRVSTLRTDVDLERRETFRVVTELREVYLGELQREDELVLTVRETDPGYGSVRANERSLLDEQFIFFLRYMEEADGAVVARWHLAPATAQVAVRVRDLLQRDRGVENEHQTRRRVVVHSD